MVFDDNTESRRNRDAEVTRLRAQGMSLRQIAATVGTSLAGVQRALRRTHTQPADPVAPVVLWELGEWPSAARTPATGEGWQVLNCLERWRYRLVHPERTDVVIHDDDHQRCCHAYGIDPDWRRQEGVYAVSVPPDMVNLDDEW